MTDETGKSVRSAIMASIDQLSTSEKRVADFTLANYARMPFIGINDLAKAVGVSNATVNRYTHALGFAGYQDYKQCLAREASHRNSEDLFRRSLRKDVKGDIRSDSILEDRRNLESMLELLEPASFRSAVESIAKARRVRVFGQGSSAFLAGYFAFNLSGLGIAADELACSSGVEGIARKALSLDKDDVVIPIAFPRFSSLTIQVVEAVRQSGCTICAITSSISTPLAEASDIVLLAPPRIELHSGSGVSAMAVIEALLADLTHTLENARDAAAALAGLVDPHVERT